MRAIVFGGAGYVGRHLRQSSRVLTDVVVADRRAGGQAVGVVRCDVREEIPTDLAGGAVPDWIVLLAAVHREPGHLPREYFETNLLGARHVADYATRVGCANIFFASTTAVYGPTNGPTDESALTCPSSPYGTSKLAAELVLEAWQREQAGRRLVIARPGVVYGPGDPGNVLRMIHAIRRGIFVFPGDPRVRKSYAYVEGFVDSIDFTLERGEPLLVYNFVDRETDTLEGLVRAIQDEFDCRRPVVSLPRPLLVGAAHASQALTLGRSSVHPVRVRKAALPTHIVPRWLIEHGFEFRFDFRSSLRHWRAVAPRDFA